MTDDDRKALGPEGVALAEALGAPDAQSGEAWFASVDLLDWTRSDVCSFLSTPIDAVVELTRKGGGLVERYALAILAELRQTRAERDDALRRTDKDARVATMWEGIYNERNRLWRESEDRVDAVKSLLEANGCDCDCGHDSESHDSDCDRCLACRIAWEVEK